LEKRRGGERGRAPMGKPGGKYKIYLLDLEKVFRGVTKRTCEEKEERVTKSSESCHAVEAVIGPEP